ncbi:hypothetical protein AB0M48_08070 [Lentzea sp. NPDC051208]|uniref:hypothetical protein n=1 Tax=Lentzea sp. NPDC051208 TaxID=3154642 RepID=UPI0034435D10
MTIGKNFEVASDQARDDDYREVVVKPLKAPASRGELRLMLILGLAGLLVSAAFAVYVPIIGASLYWLYFAAFVLVLAGASLVLAAYSYFRHVEFFATANGLTDQLEVMSEKLRSGDFSRSYVYQMTEIAATARVYADGLIAGGARNAGRNLIELSSSIDTDLLLGIDATGRMARYTGPSGIGEAVSHDPE